MGQKKSLKAVQRAKIVALIRSQRLTERNIAEELKVSKSSVHQAIVNY